MGGFFDDAQRHIVVGAARAIVDREINTSANRYFVAAEGSESEVAKTAFQALRASAGQSQAQFDTVAATEIPFWAGLSVDAKGDLFSVFANVPGATRILEVHRGSPPKQETGTFLSDTEEESLLGSAQLGASDFNAVMSAIAPGWWATVYPALEEAFWKNYQED